MGAIFGPEAQRQLQEIELRRAKRLAGNNPVREDPNRLPSIHAFPQPTDRPMCPRDAVPLTVVSYSDSGKVATRRCPCCGMTELEFIRRGVNLYPTSGTNKPAGTDENHAFLRRRELERKAKAEADAQQEREEFERDRQDAVNRVLQGIHEPLLPDTLKIARQPRKTSIPVARDAQPITFGKGRKYTPDMRTMRG